MMPLRGTRILRVLVYRTVREWIHVSSTLSPWLPLFDVSICIEVSDWGRVRDRQMMLMGWVLWAMHKACRSAHPCAHVPLPQVERFMQIWPKNGGKCPKSREKWSAMSIIQDRVERRPKPHRSGRDSADHGAGAWSTAIPCAWPRGRGGSRVHRTLALAEGAVAWRGGDRGAGSNIWPNKRVEGGCG